MVWQTARRHVACQHCRVTVSVYRPCLHAGRCNKYWVGAQNFWYWDNLNVWNEIWHVHWIYFCFITSQAKPVLWSEVCQFCGRNKMWGSKGALLLSKVFTESYSLTREGVLGGHGEHCVPLTRQSTLYRRFGVAWVGVAHRRAHPLLPAILSVSYHSLPKLTFFFRLLLCRIR